MKDIDKVKALLDDLGIGHRIHRHESGEFEIEVSAGMDNVFGFGGAYSATFTFTIEGAFVSVDMCS